MLTAASATNDSGMHSIRMPAAAAKQAFWAPRGVRAENTRCIRSMATRLPRPSAMMVAQLMTAPDSLEVSCARSPAPMPSGALKPCAVATQITRETTPMMLTITHVTPVYTLANMPPVIVYSSASGMVSRIP
jgi:hypothetical protein